MTVLIVAGVTAFVAAIGYSIWSRVRVGRLYAEIKEITQARDNALRKIELNQINLETAKADHKAALEEKRRAKAQVKAIQEELDSVLEAIAKGEISNTSAVRARLDSLLSK